MFFVEVYVFWKFIRYIHWDKARMSKKNFFHKINFTRNVLFFFHELQLITVLLLIHDSYMGWRTIRFRLVFIKVYMFLTFCFTCQIMFGIMVGLIIINRGINIFYRLEHVYSLHETRSELKPAGLKSETALKSLSVYMTISLQYTLRSSNPFQKLFCLHGYFAAATFETIVRF